MLPLTTNYLGTNVQMVRLSEQKGPHGRHREQDQLGVRAEVATWPSEGTGQKVTMAIKAKVN